MEVGFTADPVIQRMKEVIEEEENSHILQTDLRPINNLLLDVTTLLQDQQKAAQEALKIWLQLLHNCLAEAKGILHRYDPPQRQRCLDCLNCKPGKLSKEVKDWKVHFNYLFQTFQRDLSIFFSANQIIHGDPTPAMSAEESVQPLSKDEAWMLFKRIAFKNSEVSMYIEEHAKNIADECKGLPLPITLVASAMIGKNSVDEWKSCLSSIKNADPSFPDTNPPRFDKKLYQQIRWSYDALPNSNVQNCFIYCAMFPSDYPINVEKLVGMWIAEGLVRSKQGNHLLDMALGRSYINLLIDCNLFQNVTDYKETKNVWYEQTIRVHDIIRDIAIYIGEKEENCAFKADQQQENFPDIPNKDCKRISVRLNYIRKLPTQLRRPQLVSLFLYFNRNEEVPLGFLVSLTCLRVLDLSNCEYPKITSIPSSVGQLKQLEFLNLRGLDIEDLPKEICQISSLQFLDLSGCRYLQSLPSEIGELKNLKSLYLYRCSKLRLNLHEISQLTSLSKLDAYDSASVSEAASIWNMKDLRNLTMLRTWSIFSGIKVGVMGSWLEMRHLWLDFEPLDQIDDDLPQDMQNMSKLQSFIMYWYKGSRLPDHTCKFQHLQYIELVACYHLKELSPLERLPNLKYLKLECWPNLGELGIGNSGRKSGFLMLENLVLQDLLRLESIAGACNNGVWDERTLPRLRTVMISNCPLLKRLPVGMNKLLNLRSIIGEEEWWEAIIWEDESMKIHLQNSFTASDRYTEFQL